MMEPASWASRSCRTFLHVGPIWPRTLTVKLQITGWQRFSLHGAIGLLVCAHPRISPAGPRGWFLRRQRRRRVILIYRTYAAPRDRGKVYLCRVIEEQSA